MAKQSGHMPMTLERRALFLETLRTNGGIFAAAARHASPHLSSDNKGTSPGYGPFKSLMDRNPRFAAEVEQIMAEVRGEIEAEIKRRGQDGVDKPIFQGGKRAKDYDGTPATITEFSDRLLLARAKALMPETCGDKVHHTHDHAHSINNRWYIDADVIELLPDHMAEQLYEIVSYIQARQRELAHLPAPADQIVDASFEVIGYDEAGTPELAAFDLGEEALAAELERNP